MVKKDLRKGEPNSANSRALQHHSATFRALLLTLGLIIALVLTMILALSQGAIKLNVIELWQALFRQGEATQQTIIWDLRIPRIMSGVLVGASLGMSGAMLQGMLRNSLADSFVLGISSGAGLIAVILITVLKAQALVPMGAWIGALISVTIVFALGYQGGRIVSERLILGGIAIATLSGSAQTLLLLFADEGQVQGVLNWLIGSLNGRGWAELHLVAPYVAIALISGCLLGKTINLLNLGNEMAVSLGVSLVRSRILIGATASLLAASAVSISGLIGFVGLVVPHGVRLIIGNDYRWVLPTSAIAGALVLTLADLLCRIGSIEFPVGAVTALLGSPLFIWLLYRRRQGGF
ncbi:FecCD family ABC transporter permease [Leptolyngbya sp. GGD]|uniref:FecCD family ABC transporter permease n=1 Tax=Leptolyngbya sp. GGD TaxID=2997907 RepID=UPI00227CE1C2|nr:iron ABC transporter permease [Leptolyngbya sp. GGD]MCY6490886.1 iron ABC transporter permease [Leptolyngbya sp. GGD]